MLVVEMDLLSAATTEVGRVVHLVDEWDELKAA